MGQILGDINLLYVLVANHSVVDGVIGGRSIYTRCTVHNDFGALQIIFSCLPPGNVATGCSNSAHNAYGDVVPASSVGNAVGASNVVGPGG